MDFQPSYAMTCGKPQLVHILHTYQISYPDHAMWHTGGPTFLLKF
jgi:hypothetical protein